MFKPIKSAPELSQVITSTYLYDAAIALLFVLIMILVANMILWQPGKIDRSGNTRRLWFFILMVINFFTCLAFNYFAWYKFIAVPAFASKYSVAMIVAPAVATVFYFGLGFILVKASRIGTKLQSIFPKKDR